MTTIKAGKFIYQKKCNSEVTISDFKYVIEDLPTELKDKEVLCEAVYLSVDPHGRSCVEKNNMDKQAMIGGQIAKVIDSKNTKYPINSYIYGEFGWRTHTIFNPATRKDLIKPYVLPSFGKHSISLGLGALGISGNAAYFGFLELCQPEYGDTVVVSGAAGAVGSIVGQIAKIKGCRVIGIAETDDKCKWLTNEIGFDAAINYKTENITDALLKAAPVGIDCYFDNVGGELSSIILSQMRRSGRIAICGSSSTNNLKVKECPKVNIIQPLVFFNQLKIEGFSVYRWVDRWLEGIEQMLEWIDGNKIKYHETIINDFESIPKAFIETLKDNSLSKAIVKLCK